MTVDRVPRDDFLESFGNLVRGVGERGMNAVILIDIDGLIYWNDWFGHPIGDRLIEEVKLRIERASSDGVLSRIGGDEFALGIAQSSWGLSLSLGNIARGLLDAIAHEPVPIAEWIADSNSASWPPVNWPLGKEYVELAELRVTAKALAICGDAASVPMLASVGHNPRSWFGLMPTPGWMGPNSIFLVPSDEGFFKRHNNRINGRIPEAPNLPTVSPTD